MGRKVRHRPCRPGAMPRSGTEPEVSAHPGYAPLPKHPGGRLRPPPPAPKALHPLGEARLRPAKAGNAALRLQAFCVCWPLASKGRCARRFIPGGILLHRFLLSSRQFLQKSAPVLCSLLTVSIKDAALRVLRVFYKPSVLILPIPVAAVLRAWNSTKSGEAKNTNPPEKNK